MGVSIVLSHLNSLCEQMHRLQGLTPFEISKVNIDIELMLPSPHHTVGMHIFFLFAGAFALHGSIANGTRLHRQIIPLLSLTV